MMKDRRISPAGAVIIKSQQARTQEANREKALKRFRELILEAMKVRKSRRATAPTKGSKAGACRPSTTLQEEVLETPSEHGRVDDFLPIERKLSLSILRFANEHLDQFRKRRTIVTRIVIVQNLQEVLGDVRALRSDQHGGVQTQVFGQTQPTLKSSKGNSLTTHRVLDFGATGDRLDHLRVEFLVPALRVPMITSESCPSTSR